MVKTRIHYNNTGPTRKIQDNDPIWRMRKKIMELEENIHMKSYWLSRDILGKENYLNELKIHINDLKMILQLKFRLIKNFFMFRKYSKALKHYFLHF